LSSLEGVYKVPYKRCLCIVYYKNTAIEISFFCCRLGFTDFAVSGQPICSFYKRGTSAGTIQLWSGVSVMCVCVCHKSEFCRNGCVNRAGFLPSIVHCVKRKFGYLQKVGVGHSSGTLSQNSGLGKFRFGIFIVEACYRLSSTRWTL